MESSSTGYNAETRKALEQRGARDLPNVEGALVVQIYQNSPAADAGIQPQDVILKINGKPVSGSTQPEKGKVSLTDEISKIRVGDRFTMEVWHVANGRIGIIGLRAAQKPADLEESPQE